jgi:hypothetical protein
MVKRVSVLDDSATYQKIPGANGTLRVNGASVEDTVFGQDIQSQLVTIKDWGVTTPAYYKGIAGYNMKIKKGGTPTALTDEPMQLVSGKTYQITDSAKRVFDLDTALVFEDDGTPVDADDIEKIDYLWGEVTFVSGYTVTGAITAASGNYLPLATLGFGRNTSITQSANFLNQSEYDNTQASSGFRNGTYGLRNVAASVTGIYSASAAFRSQITGATIILEFNPDGNGKSRSRGFFQLMSDNLSGAVGDNEEEVLDFVIQVPNDEKLEAAYSWRHETDTTLDDAIKFILDAWESQSLVTVRYEPETAGAGVFGSSVVTDISMATDVEGQTEYSISFEGTDVLNEI